MPDISLARSVPGTSLTFSEGHEQLAAHRIVFCSGALRCGSRELRTSCRRGSSISPQVPRTNGSSTKQDCCRNSLSLGPRRRSEIHGRPLSFVRQNRFSQAALHKKGHSRSEAGPVESDILPEERSSVRRDARGDPSASSSSGREGNGVGVHRHSLEEVAEQELKPGSIIRPVLDGEVQGAAREGAPHLFGVEMTPDTVAISMVYFVQGVLGISRLAVTFFLKDDLGLDPAEVGMLTGFSSLPWLVKPLYGFISDGLPLFGYRRRSYLVLCGLVGALAWGSLALFIGDKYSVVAAILLSSLSVAFSDVVVDSMVVERARGESQSLSGSLQSLCWGSSAFGGIVSAYFSGALVESYGARFVFGVTALLPLITSAVAGLVQEEKMDLPPVVAHHLVHNSEPATSAPLADVDNGKSAEKAPPKEGVVEIAREQLLYLWETIREPAVLLPTAFIFLWQATPHSDTAMFYFTTNVLHFGPEFLGRVRLVTSVASLVGIGIFNSFLKQVPLRRIFTGCTLIGTALGLTQVLLVTRTNVAWGISDEWFMVGDSLIITVLGQISFMPVLVLAARICPEGVEATLFATLMSISNAAGVSGHLLGSGLTQWFGITSTNYDNLVPLLVLCNLSSLLALPFLGLLPPEEDIAAARAQGPIDAKKEEQ